MNEFDPLSRSPFDDDEPEDEGDDKMTRRVDDSPVIRRVGRVTEPSVDYSRDDDELSDAANIPSTVRVVQRQASSDPTVGLLIAFALNIGLAALGPAFGDLRFVIAWGTLALFGVGAWLLGTTTRIGKETTENLIWGTAFGLMMGLPLLFVGGRTLQATVELIFRSGVDGQIVQLSTGAVLALVVFVMPLGETLFFRGLFQADRPFWIAGVVAAVWSILLIFPMLDIVRFPLIAVLTGSALVLINMIYSYVAMRNGLAAAWVCQIVVNVLLFFVPYIIR